MSSGIQLSPKYGVNPTIPVCFWCGKQKNEIVMMGRVRAKDPRTGKPVRGSDVQVPHSVCLNIEPCDECAEKFAQGVLLMECVNYDNGSFSVTDSNNVTHWLTGGHAVIKDDEHKGGRCLCDSETFQEVLRRSAS